MPRTVSILLALFTLSALPALAGDPSPEALAEAGHYKRLRAIVEPRVKANPSDAEANYLLSRVKLAFVETDAALALAEKAVALDATKARYHLQLARVCGRMAQRAGMFKGMSLARRFRRETETALALDPKYIDARSALMEFYWEAPGIAGGDKKKAHQLADEVLRLDAARGYLAQASLAQREKTDQAKLEGVYRKALEADPRSYEVQITLASFYLADAQKKYDLAEKHAGEAQKLDPDRGGAYAMLAITYASAERWQQLDGALAQAEKNVPDNFNPYYQAGRILLTNGSDLPRAERYFRKYLTQEPEGNTPPPAAAHWRLGLVLEKQGRKKEAIAELENAVRLDPNFEPAKKDLKRLK